MVTLTELFYYEATGEHKTEKEIKEMIKDDIPPRKD